jgi:hypothetical protein
MHYKKLIRVFDEMFKFSFPPPPPPPPEPQTQQEDPEATFDNDDDDNEDEDDCPFDWMFEILNLGDESKVTEELLTQAYRRLARQFHPDKNSGCLEAA